MCHVINSSLVHWYVLTGASCVLLKLLFVLLPPTVLKKSHHYTHWQISDFSQIHNQRLLMWSTQHAKISLINKYTDQYILMSRAVVLLFSGKQSVQPKLLNERQTIISKKLLFYGLHQCTDGKDDLTHWVEVTFMQIKTFWSPFWKKILKLHNMVYNLKMSRGRHFLSYSALFIKPWWS